jgi:hypothetical protein
MLRVPFIVGFNLAPCLQKIALVFAKLWSIYGFFSMFSIISAASPTAANPKIVE